MTVELGPASALDEDFTMLIAIAAATEMPPAEVSALGVSVAPLPSAPLSAALASAVSRSPLIALSTDGLGPAWSASGAPAAEAVEVVVFVDVPCARNVIAPPAFAVPSTPARTVWLAIVSASAKPTAAVEPVASPAAVVVTVAAWVAVPVSAPVSVAEAPWPTTALVPTVETRGGRAGRRADGAGRAGARLARRGVGRVGGRA